MRGVQLSAQGATQAQSNEARCADTSAGLLGSECSCG